MVTQAAEIDRTISRELTFAKLCTGFAVLALLTACVGLYGTMSYSVARQAGEIGIRMALGAQRGAVVWMVLRRVLLLAAGGTRDQRSCRVGRVAACQIACCSGLSPMIRERWFWPGSSS